MSRILDNNENILDTSAEEDIFNLHAYWNGVSSVAYSHLSLLSSNHFSASVFPMAR